MGEFSINPKVGIYRATPLVGNQATLDDQVFDVVTLGKEA
jgi:hypothetical protein